MSSTLKSNILSTGNLESLIYTAINFYGCSADSPGPTDPCEAQRLFAQRLADAVAEGVARGVQAYLNSSVKTVTQPTQVNSDGVIEPHIHPNIPRFDLTAP
jgi:hypothetical protein